MNSVGETFIIYEDHTVNFGIQDNKTYKRTVFIHPDFVICYGIIHSRFSRRHFFTFKSIQRIV